MSRFALREALWRQALAKTRSNNGVSRRMRRIQALEGGAVVPRPPGVEEKESSKQKTLVSLARIVDPQKPDKRLAGTTAELRLPARRFAADQQNSVGSRLARMGIGGQKAIQPTRAAQAAAARANAAQQQTPRPQPIRPEDRSPIPGARVSQLAGGVPQQQTSAASAQQQLQAQTSAQMLSAKNALRRRMGLKPIGPMRRQGDQGRFDGMAADDPRRFMGSTFGSPRKKFDAPKRQNLLGLLRSIYDEKRAPRQLRDYRTRPQANNANGIG